MNKEQMNGTEENIMRNGGRTMVRKAEELKDLNELNLPKRTITYLNKKFNSIDEIVLEGRQLSRHGDNVEFVGKWRNELVAALNDAGYIRRGRDIDWVSINMAELWLSLTSISLDAPQNVIVAPYLTYDSNENYENNLRLSDGRKTAMKIFLAIVLTNVEYSVIEYRFGLKDGIRHSLEQTAYKINPIYTRERVRQIEAKALRKLRVYRRCKTIHGIFNTEIGIKEIEESICNEIKAILDRYYLPMQ